VKAYFPGNKRVSRLFPVTTDGRKRRYLLGNNLQNLLIRLGKPPLLQIVS